MLYIEKMSKNGDDDMDYFSGDESDSDNDSEDTKSVDSKEEEPEEILDYDVEEEPEDTKKKGKKSFKVNDEEDEEEDEHLFEDDNDDNYDDYVDDEEEEEEEMNSSIRRGGGGSVDDLETSLQNNNDEEDDDEEEMNEQYLQKFDNEINKNYIVDYHPECFVHNYEEISALTQVVRDTNNNIIDPLHKTIPFLTKYEKARIIGIRSKQINSGAKPFVQVPENVIDGYLIAEMELKEKRIPFIIKRPLAGGTCEYWKLQDLEIVGF